MLFRARQFKFRFPGPTIVMGIVNVTPDSFSDGGKFLDPGAAAEHAWQLIDEGAGILDIGGESTRPRAKPVDAAEELRRVLPVIRRLASRVKVPISIDTMKPAVARAALDAGASIVNDVAAATRESIRSSSLIRSTRQREAELQADEMWRLVGETRAGYICMHMQGTPATMQERPRYGDVVREVGRFFSDRIKRMRGCGIAPEQIILDPGIGFGKTVEHNLQLLGGLRRFLKHRRPVLLGVSRKSFLAKVPGTGRESRLAGSLACASLAVAAGVRIIRAHDVAETVQAVRVTEAILSAK
jgi:dihydropteroate synthase